MSAVRRRTFVAGLCASGAATAVGARSGITVDRFGAAGSQPTIVLLYGSDGLTNNGRYEFAAQTIASAGYTVLLPRYFEATGDSRARYGEIQTKFPAWRQALETVLADRPASARFGLVGFSLGGALALGLAARSPKIRAVVDFFGFEPAGLGDGGKLPPTLILHGAADRVVPAANAASIERVIRSQGGIVESHIYPGEGHGLSLSSLPDAVGRAKTFLQRHV